ncbi:hypothetical protein L228DRAFT_249565 [Xylona heveae TC161]|uniref:L-lactate dehydrogenase (cytochrome) n=1 Tax=Xylona heveae (strain CBS 132557 / TC161) TaxID=1328760 RepID=A0A165FA32_XYLHT|nr:hypothetical protein L228DRAFT_249565 [Xylona heveae TC161]KZF20754.1 hypothetical protein L228DRAFT_249565 [Xylona heveae TC161]
MTKLLDANEVAKHNTPESCWVILYDNVYDVTDFLSEHPGGSKIILKLSGRDATEEYDPIHPPGTLEENLKPEAKLGRIDPNTLPKPNEPSVEDTPSSAPDVPPPLDTLLNLDEIEQVATRQMSRKGWAYYFSASDDLLSKDFNNAVYRSILLRPRVFIDCTHCDTSTTLLGNKVGLPIFVSPAAMARLAHPSGEAGIAQACAKFSALQIISNNASLTPEQIVKGAIPGQVFGWQLYVNVHRQKSEEMLARVNKLSDKIKFICLTLDAPVPGKREDDERSSNVAAKLPVASAVQRSPPVSGPAPGSGAGGTGTATTLKTAGSSPQGKKGGIGQSLFAGTAPDLTWRATLPWLAQHTSLPIFLKGIQTHEDAYLASLCAPQVKAIILSNHGGRAADTAPPAVHTLLEIRKYCPEVFEKLEVWVDGGIKRGTDVVKALCLGARGVGIGRAALWGLGAGGPEGVERTFEILKAELETAMRLLGAHSVGDLALRHVNTRAVEQQLYDGPVGLDPSDLGSGKGKDRQILSKL